jgi:transcriptional regulator with XRE-family HTH domain
MGDQVFQRQLGARLRRVRRARGLTLQDVEARSDGRWKAVVVGSYERGDRAVSATKLAQLAEFYDVPVSDLMGEREGRLLGGPLGVPPLDATGVAHAAKEDPALEPLARLLEHVRWMRGDHRTTVLALRDADLRALAVTLGMPPEDLPGWLRDRGVLTTH